MFEVRKGVQTLRFEGEELAASSSRGRNKYRWVEFRLYKTKEGNYVVSRVGVSLFYHAHDCSVVRRNGILPVPAQSLSLNLIPCNECRPIFGVDEDLYPETPRYFAQDYRTAEAVVDSLKKEDMDGTLYLTDVAARLLIHAADKDEDIKNAFYVEYID